MEGTLSGFQDFFLQPIIKDRPKKNPYLPTVQPVRKTTWVGRPSRLYDHYGWQPWFLLFIWLELNDQRPTCSTRPRPLVFIDLKSFLLFIWLVLATTICPHFSASESYLILRVWFDFSPLGKLSPLLNQSERGVDTHRHAPSVNRGADWLEGQSLTSVATVVTDCLADRRDVIIAISGLRRWATGGIDRARGLQPPCMMSQLRAISRSWHRGVWLVSVTCHSCRDRIFAYQCKA